MQSLKSENAKGQNDPMVLKEKNYIVAMIFRATTFSFTSKELELLKKDREKGLSIRALARKYNKSPSTIQKYLK